jgi:hypothetical protein
MNKLLFALCILFTACQPSPEVIQTAIAKTQASYTVTPEPTSIVEPSRAPEPTATAIMTATVTPTEIELESWRIPVMPEMIEIIKNTSKSKEEKWINEGAEYYGLGLPIRWELYRLPNGTSPDVVMAYYTEALKAKGYEYFGRKGYSEYNDSYVLEYNNEGKTILITFWKNTEKLFCRVLVMYKNVD